MRPAASPSINSDAVWQNLPAPHAQARLNSCPSQRFVLTVSKNPPSASIFIEAFQYSPKSNTSISRSPSTIAAYTSFIHSTGCAISTAATTSSVRVFSRQTIGSTSPTILYSTSTSPQKNEALRQPKPKSSSMRQQNLSLKSSPLRAALRSMI